MEPFKSRGPAQRPEAAMDSLLFGIATGAGVAVAVAYFQFWAIRSTFTALYAVAYISGVLLAAWSAARLNKKFRPSTSWRGLLVKFCMAMAAALFAVVLASLLLSVAVQLTALVKGLPIDGLWRLAESTAFGTLSFLGFTWLVLPASLALAVLAVHAYQVVLPHH